MAMSESTPTEFKMAEIIRLSDKLANAVMFDRILNRHVSKDRISTLMRVAIVLHENEIVWPPLLKEVISWQIDLSETSISEAASNSAGNICQETSSVPKDLSVLCCGLRGFIEICNNEIVAGWAQDILFPDRSVHFEVMRGDEIIGTVVAESYRKDLEVAGIGNGHHAFVYNVESSVNSAKDPLKIRRVADEAAP